MLNGNLSVAVLARPALPNTLSTSGTDLMILSCTCRIRLASSFEMSGNVTGIKRIDCSSRGGINSFPRLISKGILMSTARMLIPMVVFLHFMQARMIGS